MKKPFIVKGENAFPALPKWLRENCKTANSYSYSPEIGRIYVSIGYDTKPDSDWGKYTKLGGVIVFSSIDGGLWERTEKIIRKTLGFSEAESLADE